MNPAVRWHQHGRELQVRHITQTKMFLLVSCTEKRRVKVASGARSRCVNNDSSVIKLSAKCNDPRRKNSLTGVALSARVPQDRDRDV